MYALYANSCELSQWIVEESRWDDPAAVTSPQRWFQHCTMCCWVPSIILTKLHTCVVTLSIHVRPIMPHHTGLVHRKYHQVQCMLTLSYTRTHTHMWQCNCFLLLPTVITACNSLAHLPYVTHSRQWPNCFTTEIRMDDTAHVCSWAPVESNPSDNSSCVIER